VVGQRFLARVLCSLQGIIASSILKRARKLKIEDIKQHYAPFGRA